MQKVAYYLPRDAERREKFFAALLRVLRLSTVIAVEIERIHFDVLVTIHFDKIERSEFVRAITQEGLI